MIVYVMRNARGEICGIFANAQPGFAEEKKSPDDAEVAAFLARQNG